MTNTDVQDFLSLLGDLNDTLAALTEIEQKKTAAVLQDDLQTLNDCMKQEQVLSLTLRGFEQRRQTILSAWNIEHLPLRSMLSHLPVEAQLEAKAVEENLRRQYESFRGAFEVAQNTLECNLHQIEKYLAELGLDPQGGLGYVSNEPELPKNMRTDFRA